MVTNGRDKFNTKILDTLGEYHADADNDVAVLGFLQHHDCPTPLLDWTYKFQNALYFGLDGLKNEERKREIDDYFSVYLIQEQSFENGGMRKLIYESIEKMQETLLLRKIAETAKDELQRKEMEEHFKGRKIIDTKRIKGSGLIAHMTKMEHMINFPVTYFGDGDTEDDIVFSLKNSKNILNQAGVFTWNADPAKPFEMVVSEQNNEANKSTDEKYVLCECLNINKKLADYIRKRLEADGITKELIYPTPDLNTWTVYENVMKKKINH